MNYPYSEPETAQGSTYVNTFVMNREMALATMETTRESFEKLLRYSTLRLLAWLQRAILYGPASPLREIYNRPISINEETHNMLLRQFVIHQLSGKKEPSVFDNRQSPVSTHNMVDSSVYFNKTSPLTFYVLVELNGGCDYLPLLCLNDL